MRSFSRGLIALVLCTIASVCAAQPAPLAIHGNKTTFEIAPVLLAAERVYANATTVKMGGVPNLFGAPGAPGFSEPGTADLATNAETQALRISVKNPDLRIIMTVSEGLYRIVGQRSAGIAKLADLKGKRIATIPNTSSGYFLHKMLKSVGLTLDDVTVVTLIPLSDIPKALAEGRVDAVTIWEPEMENAAEAIGKDVIEFSGKGIYREIFNLNTTAKVLADPAKRKAVVDFVRATIQASSDIRADPALGWRQVEAVGTYKQPVIAKAWPHHSFPAVLVPDLLDVMVEEEIWVAGVEQRKPRSREALAGMIDTSVLRDAMAGVAR